MNSPMLNAITIAPETTWGTPVTPDTQLPVRLSGGIVTETDVQFLSNLKSQLAKNYYAQQGNRTHEGEFTLDALPDALGYPLKLAGGSLISTLVGGETLVYDHQIVEVDTKPSLTLEQVVGENIRQYAGAVATGFKVSGKAGEPLEITLPMKAKSSILSVATTPSVFYTAPPFQFSDVRIKVDGVEYCEIEEFEYEFMNNQELIHTICDHDPAFKYTRAHEAKGKLVMYLDTAALAEYTKYLDSDINGDLEITVTGPAIGNASFYKLYITSKIVYTSGATQISDDYNKLELEFEASQSNSASGGVFDIVLTNLIPAYA